MAEKPAAFVVGDPIGHSRSPLIHRSWLAQYGLAGSYEACAVTPADFPAFIAALKEPDAPYVGGNVTVPHKEQACRLADRLDPLAEELGAVNTLWREEGLLRATNTDVGGFLASLDAGRPGWCMPDLPVVVLGAGGASRAVIRALVERRCRDIRVVNRSPERARELADRFGAAVSAHAMPALGEVMTGAGFFVNTTSLGMAGGAPMPPIDFTRLLPSATVTDIVYVPLETPFLHAARSSGLATVDGLGMLLHQAVPAFERWFGVRPAVTAELRARVVASLGYGP